MSEGEIHEIIMRRFPANALMAQFFLILERGAEVVRARQLLRRKSVAITHLNTSSSLLP